MVGLGRDRQNNPIGLFMITESLIDKNVFMIKMKRKKPYNDEVKFKSMSPGVSLLVGFL